jgi:hypothetical protein
MMKILSLSHFLSESKKELEMHFYCFDWDDNILHMPTKILMDKKEGDKWVPCDVSTTEFTIVRNDKVNYRPRNNDVTKAFSEFRDTGERGNQAFFLDTIESIKSGRTGPSYEAFIRCLSEGSLFAIITARGHEPETMRKTIEWIIENVLDEEQKFTLYSHCLKFSYLYGPHDIDKYPRIVRGKITDNELVKEYLDNCGFYGVASDSFAKEFGAATSTNPEVAKQAALDSFLLRCNEFGRKLGVKSVSLGFSDDDPKNVEHIRQFFKEKSSLIAPDYEHKVKLNIYSTVDPKIQGGKRTRYTDGQEEIHETQSSWGVGMAGMGLQNSVLPFSKWNNMTQNLYPSTKDAPKDDFHNHLKNKVSQVGDLMKPITKKIKKKNEKNKRVSKVRK